MKPWCQAYNCGTQIYPLSQNEFLHGPNPPESLSAFNPMTLSVQPDRVRVYGNSRLLFQDDSPSTTSPFLTLRTTWLSAFRKLRISGNPLIPREVALLSGDRMDGWVSSFYNESQPPALTLGQKLPGTEVVVSRSTEPSAYDWSTEEGVLHGRHFADLASPNRQSGYQHGESWLYYHRPLRGDERIQYEFFYQPGESAVEVHPTLDRLVFLLQPDGVKLHWLTTNQTQDEAGVWLATNNQANEPAHRRGAGPLPLKANDWNQASLEIRDGQVHLALNGQLVYQRPLESAWGTRFGLFHDRTKTSSRVRNVVLSGDWPEWSPQLAENLLQRTAPLAASDVQAIRTMLTPRLTADEPLLRRAKP